MKRKRTNSLVIFIISCFLSGCSFIPMTLSQAGGTVAGTLIVDKIRNEYSEELGFLQLKKEKSLTDEEKELLLNKIDELEKKYSIILEKLNDENGG
jgi:hypothetical protein